MYISGGAKLNKCSLDTEHFVLGMASEADGWELKIHQKPSFSPVTIERASDEINTLLEIASELQNIKSFKEVMPWPTDVSCTCGKSATDAADAI